MTISYLPIEQKEMAMATQPTGGQYEVIVWDYDAAPDAVEFLNPDNVEGSIAPCYVRERRWFKSQVQALAFAEEYFGGRFTATGAAVFLEGKLIEGFGYIFPYQERYW